jgi:hypothetical protein
MSDSFEFPSILEVCEAFLRNILYHKRNFRFAFLIQKIFTTESQQGLCGAYIGPSPGIKDVMVFLLLPESCFVLNSVMYSCALCKCSSSNNSCTIAIFGRCNDRKVLLHDLNFFLGLHSLQHGILKGNPYTKLSWNKKIVKLVSHFGDAMKEPKHVSRRASWARYRYFAWWAVRQNPPIPGEIRKLIWKWLVTTLPLISCIQRIFIRFEEPFLAEPPRKIQKTIEN